MLGAETKSGKSYREAQDYEGASRDETGSSVWTWTRGVCVERSPGTQVAADGGTTGEAAASPGNSRQYLGKATGAVRTMTKGGSNQGPLM